MYLNNTSGISNNLLQFEKVSSELSIKGLFENKFEGILLILVLLKSLFTFFRLIVDTNKLSGIFVIFVFSNNPSIFSIFVL